MSTLKDIFPNWKEGEEFHIEDTERWTLLNFAKGDFVELCLKDTDWEPVSEALAGFVVMSRSVTREGGIALLAHFVGTTDHTISRSLSAQFNRREGHLHLCISRPCTEAEEGFLHVVRLKVYTRGNFNASYYTAAHRRQVGKWLDGPAAGGLAEEEREEGPSGPSESRKSSGGVFNVSVWRRGEPGERRPPSSYREGRRWGEACQDLPERAAPWGAALGGRLLPGDEERACRFKREERQVKKL